MRQAFAGLLWSRQFYHYDVRTWLNGDPGQPAPPPERKTGRNHDWPQLNNADIISMPDKWEYPWYAAWDLAFHTIPMSLVDADFAKQQLILLQREWYMHPNGQLPAYEWNFSDVNPPVHAWAALRVFRIDRRVNGRGDYNFLERVFHKLLLNFTWWVNRQDAEGNNISDSTTSDCSIDHSRCRKAACWSRPMARRGWPFTARRCSQWRSSSHAIIPPPRTSPANSSSTSSTSRTR